MTPEPNSVPHPDHGGTFESLHIRNYRTWFVGALVSNLGGWMQTTALSWVVLTELTRGDATMMGLTVSLQFLPQLLLIPLTGRIIDRLDRRRILFFTETASGLTSLTIGVLLLTHTMTLSIMLCCAVTAGLALAFSLPVKQAFVNDLVRGDCLVNAVSLNSVQFNMARLAGPALAGVLIGAVGSGWVFVANAFAFVVLLVALGMLRKGEMIPHVVAGVATRLSEAVGYVRRRGDLLVLFAIAGITGAFASNFAVYASAMAVAFHEPAWGFGLLTSCYAVGSLTGAFLVARQRVARMKRIAGAAFLVSMAMLASAMMPNFWLYAATAAIVGFALITQLATTNAYVQTRTDALTRGRVIVIYLAFLNGGLPLGAPIIGWIANTWGARSAVALVGGMALLATGIGVLWLLRTTRSARRRAIA